MNSIRYDYKKGNFTQVSNEFICRNKNLSLKEKGMMIYLLSFPDDWRFSEAQILEDHPGINVKAIQGVIKSLKNKRYIKIRKIGFSWTWTIYETPYTEKGYLEDTHNGGDRASQNGYSEITQNGYLGEGIISSKTVSKRLFPNPPLSPHCTQLEKEKKEVYKKKEKKVPKSVYREAAIEVLSYLNAKAERKFEQLDDHLSHIESRFKERPELTIGDFKLLIDYKVKEWKDDDKMKIYLRPSTLFVKKHFSEYLTLAKQFGKSTCQSIEKSNSTDKYKDGDDMQEKSLQAAGFKIN